MATMTISTTLVTIECSCGGVYAITEGFRRGKHEQGGSWVCPYCHVGWGYSGRGENEQLKKQLAAERASHDQTRTALRENRIEAEKLERKAKALQRRIGAGVCPCCNRTFRQLGRHMECKHPEFVKGGA